MSRHVTGPCSRVRQPQQHKGQGAAPLLVQLLYPRVIPTVAKALLPVNSQKLGARNHSSNGSQVPSHCTHQLVAATTCILAAETYGMVQCKSKPIPGNTVLLWWQILHSHVDGPILHHVSLLSMFSTSVTLDPNATQQPQHHGQLIGCRTTSSYQFRCL